MEKNELVKHLEFYSNAIVGFVVIQGLSFCYQVGNGKYLHEALETKSWLTVGLSSLFLITAIFTTKACRYLGKVIVSLEPEHKDILVAVSRWKTYIVAVFGLMPFVVTISFVLRLI